MPLALPKKVTGKILIAILFCWKGMVEKKIKEGIKKETQCDCAIIITFNYYIMIVADRI